MKMVDMTKSLLLGGCALVLGATAAAAASLKGVCPDTIVFQTDWFPQVENSLPYQMIGDKGTIDPNKGTYTGPLGDTGVKLEMRLGGPYVGYQTVTSLMYQDPSIFLGLVSTDEAMILSGKFPTIGVLAPLTKSPQVLMFARADYPDLTSWAQVRSLKTTILYFGGGPSFMTYLLGKGIVAKDQLDSSYDGSPSRFATQGHIIQSGYVTNDVYRYEHVIPQIMKPMGYLMLNDAGYDIYPSAVSVKPENLAADTPCLKALVPMMQQAQIDYLKSPAMANAAILKVNAALKSPWVISAAVNDYGHEEMLKLGIMANSPDGTFGSFDISRLDGFVAKSGDIFKAAGVETIKPDLKGSDLGTNMFIDPKIKL
jgi:hypothetical protein